MPIIAKNYSSVLSGVNLLVVNGDDKVAAMLRDVLVNLGFGTVAIASDGYQAIKIMKELDIDLVITDWELEVKPAEANTNPENSNANNNDVIISINMWSPIPPNNGAAFVRYLRSSRHSPNQYVSIIMLTSNGQKDRIQYARDAGVNEIMLKPITAEALCYHIIQAIDHQRAFITSLNYRGPCRRHNNQGPPEGVERRIRDIQVIRYSDAKGL